TIFWIDPVEELTCIFMTQLMLASAYPLGRELRVLTYASLIDAPRADRARRAGRAGYVSPDGSESWDALPPGVSPPTPTPTRRTRRDAAALRSRSARAAEAMTSAS